MQQQQPEQAGWTPIQDTKNLAYVLIFIARALASPVEVILRTRFGSRYFSWPAVAGLFAVPLWMVFWPHESPVGIWAFWLLYLAMQLRARIETARMVLRGDHVHTRYNGWPRLSRIFKRMPEVRIKAGPEPLLVLLAGALLMEASVPLGSYLIAAAVSLFVTHVVADGVERAQAMEMNDALIEQQQVAERFRRMQNGR